MASNPYVNKVEYGGSTLIDLTQDTVAADKILYGYTAHDASGASVTGSIPDGNALMYGNSSDIVGTARVGTAYCWTTDNIQDILEIGRGVTDEGRVA